MRSYTSTQNTRLMIFALHNMTTFHATNILPIFTFKLG